MTLKTIYNEIADQYNLADQFGAITKSHEAAIAQVRRLMPVFSSDFRVLDLGVGDGSFLKKLQAVLPHAIFTGVDVSDEMLKRAAKKLVLTTIETSATEAEHFLPAHSQDLVLAH